MTRRPRNARISTRTLRAVLRLNAANSLVCGLALAVFASTLADRLGTGYPGWVRLVGLGLLPFAAFVWWVAAGPPERLRHEVPLIVAGDIAWVVASVVGLALGWFDGIGVAIVIAMAVVVDTFATFQWLGVRGLGDEAATNEGATPAALLR
ncbi:MAG: hypothetical protein AAFP84_03080 [Actinomycetota bacterium]